MVGVERVLFVAPVMEPRGTSEYTVNLASELQRRGVSVTVCCGPGSMVELMRRRDIPFQIFNRLESWLFRFSDARRLLRVAREFKPEVIHGQTVRGGRVMRYLARRMDARTVLTVHCPPERPRSFRRLARRIDGIIATSQTVRESLVNVCRLKKGKIVVVHNGVDWDALSQREPPPLFAGKQPVVGSIGPVERARGQELFLEAAAQLRGLGKDLQFLVAGQGEQLPELRRLAGTLKLEDRLTLVSDFSDYDEVLGAVDVVVQSSQVDVSGFSILGSMARGRPVIAFNTGTACEMIEDGKTGLIVPRERVESLTRAILEMTENPDRARRMGEAGRQAVAQKFNVREAADATLRFYNILLSS